MIGNKQADTDAKNAALRGSSTDMLLLQFLRRCLPISRTAIRQHLLQRIKDHAAADMTQSTRLTQIKRIDGTTPSDWFLKLTKILCRNQITALTQLRMGHVPLAYHLWRIQAGELGTCSRCNYGHESVIHYLLHCPAYERARGRLIATLGWGGRDLGNLLSNPTAIPHTFRFIDDTGRLHHIYGNLNVTKGKADSLRDLVKPASETAERQSTQRGRDREHCH